MYVGGAQVRLLSSEKGKRNKVAIKLRMNRNPVVGDKFSSRHGQKGVLSVRSTAHRIARMHPCRCSSPTLARMRCDAHARTDTHNYMTGNSFDNDC